MPTIQTAEMLDALQAWFRQNKALMSGRGIVVSLSALSTGYGKDTITAKLKTADVEALVQLWETGESEFEYLDWKAADADLDNAQVENTHYEFAHPEELFAALNALAARLSGHALPQTAAL